MAWCMIFMVLGALIFGAGIAFERLISAEATKSENEEQFLEQEDTSLRRQWENLLGYDGTRQEEFDDENR
ncbi:MAG: hypothetical protein IJ299_06085 [Oscillospiraceae bacterium]|nr:hypothetical protein [Oscillospiraceae bacterium]